MAVGLVRLLGRSKIEIIERDPVTVDEDPAAIAPRPKEVDSGCDTAVSFLDFHDKERMPPFQQVFLPEQRFPFVTLDIDLDQHDVVNVEIVEAAGRYLDGADAV